MKTRFPLGCLIVVLGGLAATGCIASQDEEVNFNAPGSQDQAITFNAITFNAITFNAITFNAITFNALTTSTLAADSLTSNALSNPDAREVFTYIVSCALPEGQSISVQSGGQSYSFDGSLGLAPEWGRPHGKCDETCQEWVSACVLARTDYLGEHVGISIRGRNRALDTSFAERVAYSHREATYYGNIFSNPPRYLACLSPGETQDPRVCGPSLEDCPLAFQGTSCADVCGRPTADGAFTNCRGPVDDDDDDQGCNHGGHSHSKPYVGSITVYLKP